MSANLLSGMNIKIERIVTVVLSALVKFGLWTKQKKKSINLSKTKSDPYFLKRTKQARNFFIVAGDIFTNFLIRHHYGLTRDELRTL